MNKKQKQRKAKRIRHMTTSEDGAEVFEDTVFGISEAVRLTSGQGMSHEDIRDALNDAIRAELPEGHEYYCWVQAVYDSAFVYEHQTPDDRQLYRRSWSIDPAGDVLMGQPEAVVKVISYEPVAASTEAAEAANKTEGDKQFGAADYAYVPDKDKPSSWKLRLTNTPGGKPDARIVGAAVAALGKGFRGQKVQIPVADLPAVKTKVRAAWKKANPDKKAEEIPGAIKESAMDEGGEVDISESATDVEGPLMALIETKVRADGTLPVKLIDAGWGSSGYYGADMLRENAAAFKKGTQMHLDHMTPAEEAQKPEGSVATLAAVLDRDAYYMDDGPDGPGVYGDAKVLDHQKSIIEAIAPYVGLSIRASALGHYGEAEGKKGPIIEKITKAKRVDFVTEAGRGGKVLEVAESMGYKFKPVDKEEEMNEKEVQELKESNKTLQEEIAELTKDAARKGEALITREAADVVATVLADAQYKDVPELTRARLQESEQHDPPVKEGKLDKEALKARVSEAVKAEADYIAGLSESGKVRGMGGSRQTSESDDASGEFEEKMKSQFQRLGLSESAAAHAAAGRS